jgi:hypothetical protein
MSHIERPPVALMAIGEFVNSLGLARQEYMVKIGGPIYHYTDLGALSSIVSNHDLWLTNSQYSNDKDESRHGYEIARSVVEELLLDRETGASETGSLISPKER